MASFNHFRSNSLPTSPHPVAARVDEQLSKLRSFNPASTSSSSICQNINGLQDLHDCLEKLLQLPLAHETLSREQNKKMVDELLDGSLRLLDVCSITKDALLQTKESLNEIQSILRRKRGGLESEVKKYLASRKSLKKTFQQVLKNLKATNNKDNGDDTLAVLKEAEALTASVFESLVCFVSGSNTRSKPSGKWSFVPKLMKNKRVSCEEDEDNTNEFARVDSAWHLLVENKSDETMKIADVQSLEMCIQDFEESLDSLFRSMIKCRVSVLNVQGN